ncbi:hypothetical protein Vadar_008867 [Vaccinium darrowii]|uniref:Uncharacterized protein n=1 Tax=Vaccinium darrowii TaxID=229202 RepID=A0ACB7ZIB8_9ERIC|nr:hypothetical protein Vadar_008867 [Vaccinium darrowii]
MSNGSDSKSLVNSNSNTQLVTVQSDFSTAIPFGFKLNGSNYTIWSQMMELHATGQEKMGHLTGDTPQPAESDPGFQKWQRENAVVKGWLVKTMEPDLLGLFLGLPTAAAVWGGVSQMYYDGADDSQLYELRCKATRIKQGGRLVPVYFAELKAIWQELDKRHPISMACPIDIKARQDEIMKDRIYDFLAGLDDVFDKVRSYFLRLKPLPGLEDSFAYIRREAQRQNIMLGSGSAGGLPSVAMVSKALSPPISRPPRFTDVENKDALRCTFCNGARHTANTCFKKNGFPDWYLERCKQLKGEHTTRRPGVAAIVATGITPFVDSSHKSVVSHCSPSDQNTSPIYHLSLEDSNSDTSNLGKALISSNDCDPGWIIDSGVTDHMTYDKSLFQYASFPRKDHVITANGETVHVTGASSIALTPSLSLHHTLLIPTLSNNLLSDIQTREIIGHGTKRGGLYYVDDITTSRVLKGETHVEIEGPDWFEVILEDVLAETVSTAETETGSTAETETGLSPVLKDVSDPPDTLERLSTTPDIVIADSVDDSPSRDSIVPAHAPMDIPERNASELWKISAEYPGHFLWQLPAKTRETSLEERELRSSVHLEQGWRNSEVRKGERELWSSLEIGGNLDRNSIDILTRVSWGWVVPSGALGLFSRPAGKFLLVLLIPDRNRTIAIPGRGL